MKFREDPFIFGTIQSVDGSLITVKASKLKINNQKETINVEVGSFVNCGGGHGNTICLITRVLIEEVERRNSIEQRKIVELSIIGSLKNKKFTRGTERLPTIGCSAYLLKGEQIEFLLGIKQLSDSKIKEKFFKVGKRPMLGAGDVYFNLDKLLGRHVAILGTTGSGKSCTVATITQSILRSYKEPRLLFFDIHNEYDTAFQGEWKNKSQSISWSEFSLPYWFLDFDEFISIYYPDAGGTQQALLKTWIEELKKDSIDNSEIKNRISVDTPVFFDFDALIQKINDYTDNAKSTEKTRWSKVKLKISSKHNDSRYEFLKRDKNSKISLEEYFTKILGLDKENPTYISILDLSGLPSEIRTICVGVLARLCFDYCYWDLDPNNLPLALILEEAHNYIPDNDESKYRISLERIEKIAKEGRKYGISLVVVSQRPSNVSSTVLSQCGTFITLRMTNDTDQNKIRRLLPDTLGNQANILPSLRDGEALVTGDAVTLPSKVYFDLPNPEPKSKDVTYHKSWNNGIPSDYDIKKIIYSWKVGERKIDSK